MGLILTTNDFKDSEVFEELMDQVGGKINQVIGDGAYDSRNCYEWAERTEVMAVFPPRSGARIRNHGNMKGEPLQRDEHIRKIKELGRKKWKIKTGYHRKSLAETVMFRIKQLFGEKLRSRLFKNQVIELILKTNFLNQWKIPTTCS